MFNKQNIIVYAATAISILTIGLAVYAWYFQDPNAKNKIQADQEIQNLINFFKEKKNNQAVASETEVEKENIPYDPAQSYKASSQDSIEEHIAVRENRRVLRSASQKPKLSPEEQDRQEAERHKAIEHKKLIQERQQEQFEALKKRRALQKQTYPLKEQLPIFGNHYPYKMLINPGWKILESETRLVVSWKDEVTVTIETGPWITTQTEFNSITLEEISQFYPKMKIAEIKTINMGFRPWISSVLQDGEETESNNPRQLMVLSNGSRKGSYRVVIGGFARALDKHVNPINKLLKSFRFPPDNYKPENAHEVRIYIDGVRQFF